MNISICISKPEEELVKNQIGVIEKPMQPCTMPGSDLLVLAKLWHQRVSAGCMEKIDSTI